MSAPIALDNSKPGHLASVVVLASAARTANPTVAAFLFRNISGRALVVYVDVTAVTATPQLTVTIKGQDPESGTKYTMLASAVLATTGLRRLIVSPDLTAAANSIAKDVVPQDVEISVDHGGDSDSITYSVSATFLPQ